jgi:maltoporin
MHTPMKTIKPTTRSPGSRTAAALVLTCALASPVFAQSSADLNLLRAEMKADREAYEARIAALEKRLATVETTPATPTTPAAPPVNVEQRLTALEKSSQETAKALDEVFSPTFVAEGMPKDATRNFEFHGYLRSGYGINQDGGGQERVTSPDGLFQIGPGRLGNEEDTYGELGFKYNFPTEGENAAKFGFKGTFAFKYAGDKNNYTVEESNRADLLIREAFVTASNVIKSAPDVQFWAGQRFYDRHDIHIYDFYFLDTSGYGGGVEQIDLGPGKLAIAYLGGTDATSLVEGRYSLTKQVLDIRWSELPVLGGKGMLWISPQYVNGGSGVNPEKTEGVATGWFSSTTSRRATTRPPSNTATVPAISSTPM